MCGCGPVARKRRFTTEEGRGLYLPFITSFTPLGGKGGASYSFLLYFHFCFSRGGRGGEAFSTQGKGHARRSYRDMPRFGLVKKEKGEKGVVQILSALWFIYRDNGLAFRGEKETKRGKRSSSTPSAGFS